MGKALKFFVSNLEEIVAACFLIVTTVLVIVNVFMRYVMNTGIVWSEEVATGCFVWTVFIGAAACYKRKAHVGVDILVNMMPPTMQKVVNLVVDAILLVLNSYISYLTVSYIQTSYTKTTPVTNVSSAYISGSILVAFVIMSLYSVVFIYKDIRDFGKKTTVKEGEA
ncbi:TRAP transporter small permease [Chakrabartyella piscis]|uniref:TRAP transporter small permease n=1 Tax=Chakrabartyella piscis TaxID=2918914 RepID=UPI0029584E72|nr:TRAP transporter small permease [Chakrabartyella piscis]